MDGGNVSGAARSLLSRRIVRVFLNGVIAVGLQTVVFETLAIWLRLMEPSTATVFGAEAATLTSFTLNRYLAFSDRPKRRLWLELLEYHLVVSGSLLIQWSSLFVTEHLTANLIAIHAVYVASILAGFVWNYTWYTLWVWRKKPEASLPSSSRA